MTTITSIFSADDEADLRLTIEANDIETDTITIEINGTHISMPVVDLRIAMDFMERAAKAVRRVQ